MTIIPGSAMRQSAVIGGGVYVLRRLATSVIALLGVTLIVFLLSHNVGDPVYLLAGQNASDEQREALREQLGYNRPLVVQYLDYLGGLLQGDLGTSTFSRQPVSEALAAVFPATLELALAALLLTVLLALPLGVWAALHPATWIDRLITGFVRFGVAMPTFWLGILLIYVFTYTLGIAPAPTGELDIGMSSPPHVTGMTVVDAAIAGDWAVFANAIAHLVLPSIALAFGAFPALLALTRDVVGRVLRSDHFRTARAMGLPPQVAYARYAVKSSAAPIAQQVAMTFGYLLGGTVLVEIVFAWPGVGQYAVLSMQRLDFAPVIGVALLTSALYLLLYFIADLVSLAIDPRIRRGS
ncbi:ABC transporter permease [Agromyces sp. SYSU T00194]|uniref:ABC transporter permease n=1 Tax=Agromyces chitinivorans TaxID=3158560 RepID=UPI0033968807